MTWPPGNCMFAHIQNEYKKRHGDVYMRKTKRECTVPLKDKFLLHNLIRKSTDGRAIPSENDDNCKPSKRYNGGAPCVSLLNEHMIPITTITKKGLHDHAFTKHGACIFDTPESYLCKAVALYEAYKLDALTYFDAGEKLYSVSELDKIIKIRFNANAYIKSASISRYSSSTSRPFDRENWLSEIFFCFDENFKPINHEEADRLMQTRVGERKVGNKYLSNIQFHMKIPTWEMWEAEKNHLHPNNFELKNEK